MSSSSFRLLAALPAVLFLWGISLSADEKAAGASRGRVERGARAPFRIDNDPPPPTREQLREREEEAKEAHPGPPLPVLPGAVVAPPAVPPTPASAGTAESLMRLRSDGNTPAAPGSMTFYRATAQGPYATGTSTVSETHAGAAGPVVFMTGNWFASYSTNNGSSFSFVNPYTTFGTIDDGFCCDQTVIYDRARDQMIWQLQYGYSTSTSKNTYVTAFAPASSVQSAGWCWYTWSPSDFGLGSGLWLDYPNVAVSNNYVWYTANVYNAADAWRYTLIWRIPLSAVTSCGGFTYDYMVVSDRFNFAPVQGATTTMYWASHNNTSSIRVYRWAENSSTIYWDDVAIGTWPRALPYSCAGPDGLNWCGRGPNDGRVQTGWVANGVIGFMWNASGGGGFPYPHVRVVRLNESTRALLSEPIIWHNDYAWQFPAIGVNDRGHIAGSAYWGGGSHYPTMVVLIADDYSATPPPWENYGVVTSAKGGNNRWGDWYSSRRHGASGNTWITTGQAVLANSNVEAWYVWFGRERDNPSASAPAVSTPTSSSVTTTTAILGGTVTGDGGAPITERGVVYSATATNANPLIGGSGVTKATTTGTTGTYTLGVSNLVPATSYSYKAFATNSAGTGYSGVSTFSTSVFTGPASLTATAASTTQVGLVWPSVANAAYYEIARSSGGGYSAINTSGTASYTDTTVSANASYLYKVRAIDAAANVSTYSPVDPATTVIFTNDPVVTGDTVRAVHIAQLRTAVNAMRTTAGLPAATFTDPLLSTVKAQHVLELRAALDEARAALLLAALSYTDPLLAFGTSVKAPHVQQLRTGVK